MKMIYRKLPKTASLSVTCHSNLVDTYRTDAITQPNEGWSYNSATFLIPDKPDLHVPNSAGLITFEGHDLSGLRKRSSPHRRYCQIPRTAPLVGRHRWDACGSPRRP